MDMTTKRALTLILVAASIAGCGSGGGDKAGGSSAPAVLRLAAADDAEQPDARLVRHFAARVAELSGGSLEVRVTWDAGGAGIAREQRIARRVRDGRFELGWIGARAWDRLGVKSFQALQAPFLVTDQALLGRIAAGPLASQMLAGLDAHGFIGLALAPDRLRYPFGARHPLASPDDFAGARVRVQPSGVTEALIRALGATPVHVSGDDVGTAVANGDDRRRRGVARHELGRRGRDVPRGQRRAVREGPDAVRGPGRVRAARRGAARGGSRGGRRRRSRTSGRIRCRSAR